MDNNFPDIEVVEDNSFCDFCNREMKPGEEIAYENSSHFNDVYYICPRCYEGVQTSEPLEM